MSPSKAYVVLAALVAAGCASNPEVTTHVDAAEAVATAAPTLAAAPSPATTGSATVVPDAVIDANELVADTPPRPICREMLRPNSNVRTKYCMSAEQWKIYERAEAQRAGELVRTWQGGDYR
jgi:hypothetical protein